MIVARNTVLSSNGRNPTRRIKQTLDEMIGLKRPCPIA